MVRLTRTKALLVAAALLLTAANVDARQITLVWDANSEPSVVGYIVSYGTQSREVVEYPFSVDVGNRLSLQLELPGDQYYFAVRAYDADGNLSQFSYEAADAADVVLTNPGDQFHMAGEAVSLPLVARGSAVSYSASNLPPGVAVDARTGQISGTLGPIPAPSSYLVTVRASDPRGNISSVQFMWSLRVNHAPAVANPGAQSAIAGGLAQLVIVASDNDGDALTYSAVGLPAGLQIDAATGVISGTVAAGAAPVYNVTVFVSDGRQITPIEFSWSLSPRGALVVDQVVFAESNGSEVTTEPFSTSIAGETLVAFVSGDEWPVTGAQTAWVTGGGLNWMLVTRANTQAGTSEIWTATAPDFLSNITVSAGLSVGGVPVSLTIVTFNGSAGIGASGAASGATGPPTVALRTTKPGSFVYGVGNDWDGPVERTLGANQALAYQTFTATGDTFWVQHYIGRVAAAGTVVELSDTAPTDHRWNFAAVEILPLAPLPTVTVSPAIAAAGTIITATVNDSPGNPADFVGLFKVDASAQAFEARQYLNGLPTPPVVGLTHATVAFVAPAMPGLYNVRLFAAENSTTPIATSNSVLVPSSLTIDHVSIAEGHSGTTTATMTVTLTPASPVDVTVNYATADGSATAGTDYVAGTGTLTFPAGTTTQTISLTVNGDTTIEPNETFVVNLSDATNAVIAGGQGQATIVNDDFPVLTIHNVTVLERNSGTNPAVFIVRLKPASPMDVTVDYATADGTATAGSDYVAKAGTLTFPAGTTLRTISVMVNGDTMVEPDETFFVNLSNPTNAVIQDGEGRGTIRNDDLPEVTIDNVAVVEGNNGTTGAVFTVKLSAAVSHKVTVRYATSNGTARAGSDYQPVSGFLTFAPGMTTRTITVPVRGDTIVEPNETFFVNLTAARHATLGDAHHGLGTIINDDVPPGRMSGAGRIDEGRMHHHFVFRMSERKNESGRLEFWSIDGRNCDGHDDGHHDGDHDGDFGRERRRAVRRFESIAITSVRFSDDPAFTPGTGRPGPTMDSVVFAGLGRWNGKPGYTFEGRATDQGEPGRGRDTFALVVQDRRGTIVASLSGKLDSGNIRSTRLTQDDN